MASVGQSNEAISLNLNPMLDVFSILITFLLMSFSTDPVNHDVNEGIELPNSDTSLSLDEVPTIVVTKDAILVNDKRITTLVGGDVVNKDLSQGGVYPLFTELQKLQETNKRLLNSGTASRAEKEKSESITLEMDLSHKFKLLKRIMLTAQQAEFITFKYMVAKQGE